MYLVLNLTCRLVHIYIHSSISNFIVMPSTSLTVIISPAQVEVGEGEDVIMFCHLSGYIYTHVEWLKHESVLPKGRTLIKTSKLSLRDSELVKLYLKNSLCILYNNASHDLYIVEPRLAQNHK